MIKYYEDLEQGSDEWLAARCGILTASEVKLVVTPTLKPAKNDKERTHLYQLLAQRITNYVEPSYVSDAMLRGQEDEVEARIVYHRHFAPVRQMGFIVNDTLGFPIGYSPDGLVGDDGLIECKSRGQKYQAQTILENVPVGTIPDDYLMQVQTAFLVSERKWCDFISYCGGMPMVVIRIYPDTKVIEAIAEAATAFEARLQAGLRLFSELQADPARKLIPTERRVELEIVL